MIKQGVWKEGKEEREEGNGNGGRCQRMSSAEASRVAPLTYAAVGAVGVMRASYDDRAVSNCCRMRVLT